MTREEVIKVLEAVDENASCDDCLYYAQMEDCPIDDNCIIRKAIWAAISALQKPTWIKNSKGERIALGKVGVDKATRILSTFGDEMFCADELADEMADYIRQHDVPSLIELVIKAIKRVESSK